jgi:hypothetical protein
LGAFNYDASSESLLGEEDEDGEDEQEQAQAHKEESDPE